MNYICTWFCADRKGKESLFPQTGELSSSQKHQEVYWRCILLFYATSKRFNTTEKHVFFTNLAKLPVLDGQPVGQLLNQFNVEVVFTSFNYETPAGYFGSFQNQFYEFSILEHIAHHSLQPDDQYLILDSDCIFLKPAKPLFDAAAAQGFISFADPVKPDYVINGLCRNDLKAIYEDLLGKKLDEIPDYHLGEFLLCSVENIKKIFADFQELWPKLMERFANGQSKFNEEAHTLSYLYFKNGFRASTDASFMRRLWTNPVFYREIRPSDKNLIIWHLPSEKIFGFKKMYQIFFKKLPNFGFNISDSDYRRIAQKEMSVPDITTTARLKYYWVSYTKALKKRFKKWIPQKNKQ